MMSLYESNASGSKIHLCRVSEFEDAKEALYKWYVPKA